MEGDSVVNINGRRVCDRSHDEAVELLDTAGDTLTLQIYRGEVGDLGQLLTQSKLSSSTIFSTNVQQASRSKSEIGSFVHGGIPSKSLASKSCAPAVAPKPSKDTKAIFNSPTTYRQLTDKRQQEVRIVSPRPHDNPKDISHQSRPSDTIWSNRKQMKADFSNNIDTNMFDSQNSRLTIQLSNTKVKDNFDLATVTAIPNFKIYDSAQLEAIHTRGKQISLPTIRQHYISTHCPCNHYSSMTNYENYDKVSHTVSPSPQPLVKESLNSDSMPTAYSRHSAVKSKQVWQTTRWPYTREETGDRNASPHQQTPTIEKFKNTNNRRPTDARQPRQLSVTQRQGQFINHTGATHHSLSAKQVDPTLHTSPEDEQREGQTRKLKIFAPPVEISGQTTTQGRRDSRDSVTSSSVSSTLKNKKLFSDSAFYEDPCHYYPTIEDQIKLCRLISQSLTSAANKTTRGAMMFAKRRRYSINWEHDSRASDRLSSAGDVADLDDLDSELWLDHGGVKPLLSFRTPPVKHHVNNRKSHTAMSLGKDDFERLRLEAKKCDHRVVSPGLCFDIVADLRTSKGRGGRMFERRKNRADKFIIDADTVRPVEPRTKRLQTLPGIDQRQNSCSPLEKCRNIKPANRNESFLASLDDLTTQERHARINRILQYEPPVTVVANQPCGPTSLIGHKTDLRCYLSQPTLRGRNFNNCAKGWHISDSAEYQDEKILDGRMSKLLCSKSSDSRIKNAYRDIGTVGISNCGRGTLRDIVEDNCGRGTLRDIVEDNCGRGTLQDIVEDNYGRGTLRRRSWNLPRNVNISSPMSTSMSSDIFANYTSNRQLFTNLPCYQREMLVDL